MKRWKLQLEFDPYSLILRIVREIEIERDTSPELLKLQGKKLLGCRKTRFKLL